jgi:hypothetical protein
MIQFLAEIRQQVTVWRFEQENVPLWLPVRSVLVPIKWQIISQLDELNENDPEQISDKSSNHGLAV